MGLSAAFPDLRFYNKEKDDGLDRYLGFQLKIMKTIVKIDNIAEK